MSLWVGPAYSLHPLPVTIRQADIEYQLWNMKGRKSEPVLLIMLNAISRVRPVALRENIRSIGLTFFFFGVVKEVLHNCFHLQWVTEVKCSAHSSRLIY